ncbi:hypothetical protein FQA39_LY17580 [Lamprigera yunnana]|nr:hypothetical protein FQA39_LY17580 [Lamprigera yunnana]
MEAEEGVEVDDAVSALGTDATRTSGAVQSISTAKEVSHDSIPALHTYQIKPTIEDKFKENPVKEIIRSVLVSKLGGKNYDSENAKKWTVGIANEVNTKVRDLQPRSPVLLVVTSF